MSERMLSSSEAQRLLADRHSGSQPLGFARSRRPPVRPGRDCDPSGALRALHQTFARRCELKLAEVLRTPVELQLTSVAALSYREFVADLDSPTSLTVVQVDSFNEPLLLEFSPGILLPIIDRLLGGSLEATAVLNRPLTEIERRLTAHFSGLCLAELHSVWEEIVPLDLSVERVESDRELATALPAAAKVVEIVFAISMHAARGTLKLALPQCVAERLVPSDAATTAASTPGADAAATEPRGRGDSNVPAGNGLVGVVAHLAESTIGVSDLQGLRPGDIITTSQSVDAPWVVSIDGVPKFHARAGALHGRKAIQVDGLIDPPA